MQRGLSSFFVPKYKSFNGVRRWLARKEDELMSTYKYKHLTLDERIAIQKALKEGHSFVDIAALIGKDPSTVSKEVKAHLTIKETGTRSRGYNPCARRNKCEKMGICKEGCIPEGMPWHYEPYCVMCSKCNKVSYRPRQ